MDPLRYVRSGDKRAASAATQNALIDAARFVKNNGRSFREERNDARPAQIYVKAHADLDRFDHVGIDSHVMAVSETGQFHRTPVFNSDFSEHGKPFAIVTEAAAINTIARAVLVGMARTKVMMFSDLHEYADINASGQLVSSTSGYARILWFDPEPEESEDHTAGDPWEAWCLLSLGDTKQARVLPSGQILLYRGAIEGDMQAGKWYYIGDAVIGLDSSVLGFEASTTDAGNGIAILQEAMPDPYTSVVPVYLDDAERLDYAVASVSGISVCLSAASPFWVPSSATGGGYLTGKTVAEIFDLLDAVNTDPLAVFQEANIWKVIPATDGPLIMFRVDPSFFVRAGAGLLYAPFSGREKLGLDPEPTAWLTGNPITPENTGPWAHCMMPDGTFSFVQMGSGGDAVSSGSPAIDVANGAEGKEISLVGDGADVEGLYYADGLGGYDFIAVGAGLQLVDNAVSVKVANSVVTDLATGAIGLYGDESAPTAGKYYGAHPVTGALGWHAGTALDVIVSIQWNSTNHTLEVKKQTVTIIDAEAVQNWAVVTTAAAGAAQMNTGTTVGHTH